MSELQQALPGASDVCGTVHLIGILGTGMSALARLCIERGLRVTGSDTDENGRLAMLQALGARISIGNSPANLEGAERVIFSPAVSRGNPELSAARAHGVPTATRARALADLLGDQETICVAGSHGKTTTTALLAVLLDRSNLRPGYMIGVECPSLGARNARWTGSGLFVNESCEAFRALDFWHPRHCIVTNVDDEHSDHYGSFADLKDAFADFVRRVPAGGKVLLCGECPTLQAMAAHPDSRADSYGFGPDETWRAQILEQTPGCSRFGVWHRGDHLATIALNLPGRHNILNALAAVAMAANFGVAPAQAAMILRDFQSMPRRWQAIGEQAGIRVYDDLAHHPAEVTATLNVARETAGQGAAVVAVFQPQLHSRVSRLAPDFAQALGGADKVILLPIDSAGEPPAGGESEAQLRDALHDLGADIALAGSVAEASLLAADLARRGDIVVTMGAGLAQRTAPEVLAVLARPEQDRRPAARLQTAPGDPAHPAPGPRLHARFELHAMVSPDAACIVEGSRVWTYAEIDRMARSVAGALSGRGLGRGDLVVLTVGKSARFIALVLGALKAGCAFVPIDPTMMRASLQEKLGKVGVGLVIHEPDNPPPPGVSVPSILLEDFWQEAQAAGAAPGIPDAGSGGRDLAYAVFTSGSTGTPRLVGVEHRNICNIVQYSTRNLFDPQDLAVTPFIDSISFDVSVHQVFAPLSTGGCLLIAPDMAGIVRSADYSRITYLGGTPSVIARLAELRAFPKSLRVISLAGEVVPQALISTLRRATGITRLYNFYGPSETTIFSTASRLLDRDRPLEGPDLPGNNIGFPVAGTTIYLVDAQDRIVPAGETGEICIAGAGVARGYLGDPARTAERFGPDIFAEAASDRMYRTGDLGRRLPDGSIEILGRMDDQVKINGIRIDPVEIELHLDAFPGIERAAVVTLTSDAGHEVLTAFVIADDAVDLEKVRRTLATQVPSAMVPKSMLRVASLPMTGTGKLNRRDLRNRIQERTDAGSEVVTLDGVERRLLAIWHSVLKRPDLTADDDFFQFGGDSLAWVHMVLAVEEAFGTRLSAQVLETVGTVSKMAARIRSQLADPKSLRASQPDLATRILDKQTAFLAAWNSDDQDQKGFVRSLNREGTRPGLFWCFQGYHELRALAAALGPDRPVHGMRSGFKIMEYMPETIAVLAHRYSDDMIRMQASGAFVLGGNCQGAAIARATAQALRQRGREVSHLLLMEQAGIWPYDRNVGLIFGHDSSHNPYRNHADPEPVFRNAYPQGYTVRIVDGGHGSFFTRENVGSLAAAIRMLIAA